MTSYPMVCPHCKQPSSYMLPVEPVYDLQFIIQMQLLPMTRSSLYSYLRDRPDLFPARYRLDTNRHRHRMLTLTEINKIRDDVLFSGKSKDRKRLPYVNRRSRTE